MSPELTAALVAFTIALLHALAAELRLRTTRRMTKDARRRSIDAQRASGATRRKQDDPEVVTDRRDEAQ